MLKEFFKRKILETMQESVDRAVRGEEDDYPEENEGPGTTYEDVEHESVDRATRGEETEGEYEEEDEGAGVTYENLKFETNLYHDADLEKVAGKEDIAHDASVGNSHSEELSESDDEDDDDEKPKSHAAVRSHSGDYPGPPSGFGEGRVPSLKEIFSEGNLSEVAPPGWEKTVKKMKKHKDIENPFALAWSMKNKGAHPGGSEEDEKK